MNQSESKFFTPEEVSELFLIPRRTIQILARNKRIPAFKVGRRWRFKKEDIEKWIQTNYGGGADLSEVQRKTLEIVEGIER